MDNETILSEYRQRLTDKGMSAETIRIYTVRAKSFFNSGLQPDDWIAAAPGAAGRGQRSKVMRSLGDYRLDNAHRFKVLAESEPEAPPSVIESVKGYAPRESNPMHPGNGKFVHVLDKYGKWMKAKGRSRLTISFYRTRIRAMLEGNIKYLDFLAEPESDHERNQRVKALRSFIKFCKQYYPRSRFAKIESVDGVRVPERVPPVYITREQADVYRRTMERMAGRREYAAFMLAFGCGLRAREIETLLMDDINFDDPFYVVVSPSKYGKTRVVPLPSQARDAILQYMLHDRVTVAQNPNERRLFLGDKGGRFDLNDLRTLDREVRRACNIRESAHPVHNWRHVYATHLREQGVSIEKISQLLGHRMIATTQAYLGAFSFLDLSGEIRQHHLLEQQERINKLGIKVV